MEVGTGARVYSERLNLSCSFRLPDGCLVFQAEVSSNLRAALGAMTTRITDSKLVRKCRESLNELAL